MNILLLKDKKIKNKGENIMKKSNSLLYNVKSFNVTKHALARFMQRTQNTDVKLALRKMQEYLKNSYLICMMPDGFEKRNYNFGNLGKENMMFICKNVKDSSGKDTKIVITVLIGRMMQLRRFSNSMEKIEYEKFDMKKIKEIDILDTVYKQ